MLIANKGLSIQSDSFFAKTQALIYAVSLGCDGMFSPIIIKLDSLDMVQALSSQVAFKSILGLLIDDAKMNAASIFPRKIQHCPRNANGVAHALVKTTPISPSESLFIEKVPPKF